MRRAHVGSAQGLPVTIGALISDRSRHIRRPADAGSGENGGDGKQMANRHRHLPLRARSLRRADDGIKKARVRPSRALPKAVPPESILGRLRVGGSVRGGPSHQRLDAKAGGLNRHSAPAGAAIGACRATPSEAGRRYDRQWTQDGPPMHCDRGSVRQRQDQPSRRNPRPHRRDREARRRGERHDDRRFLARGARPLDERGAEHRRNQFHGRELYLSRLPRLGGVRLRERAGLAGGRRGDRRRRARREEDSRAAGGAAQSRRAPHPALPVPEQDRQGVDGRARRARHAAAGLRDAAGAAADPDLEGRGSPPASSISRSTAPSSTASMRRAR